MVKLSHFKFGSEEIKGEKEEFVVYTENGSKNHSGSYKSDNKVVTHYANRDLQKRCYNK